MRSCNNTVLVLADDFTGANDAGVSLAEVGMRVDVAFRADYQGDADALILNSDSRAFTAELAVERVETLLTGALSRFHPRRVMKKIDSTLRGNIGAEIAAMTRVLGCELAILAPAYPRAGRVTQGGCCYVNGQPLSATEFASDPKTPVIDARIDTLVGQQTSLPCEEMTVATLAAAIQKPGAGPRVLIVDATTDSELDDIVLLAAQYAPGALLVGSAGLCEALARNLSGASREPLLALVGSMSEIAQRQVAELAGHPRVQRVDIDVMNAFSASAAADAQRIARVIVQGHHCVMTTAPDGAARENIEQRCRSLGLTRAQFGEQICRYLADVVKQVLATCSPGALYLSGGDAAIAVATVLNASGFHITGRVAQCVPYGHFLGGSWQRLVMTKAGGFGSETTLREVVDFIEEKLSD